VPCKRSRYISVISRVCSANEDSLWYMWYSVFRINWIINWRTQLGKCVCHPFALIGAFYRDAATMRDTSVRFRDSERDIIAPQSVLLYMQTLVLRKRAHVSTESSSKIQVRLRARGEDLSFALLRLTLYSHQPCLFRTWFRATAYGNESRCAMTKYISSNDSKRCIAPFAPKCGQAR
jgi:hypothetical protein